MQPEGWYNEPTLSGIVERILNTPNTGENNNRSLWTNHNKRIITIAHIFQKIFLLHPASWCHTDAVFVDCIKNGEVMSMGTSPIHYRYDHSDKESAAVVERFTV